MLGADGNKPAILGEAKNKPVGKSGQRNRKKKQQSGKTAEPSRKSAEDETAKSDQSQAAQEQVNAGSIESSSTDTPPANADQSGSSALGQELQEDREQVDFPITSHESSSSDDAHTNIEEVALAASTDPTPVSLQSLAKAYEDCARNSFERSRLFLEKLASVRSLDSALELQTDFMKHVCESFIADTQKIRDIHRGMAQQRVAYLEGLIASMPPIAYILRAPRN